MENKDQPAYPIDSDDLKQVETGLTKREYFAGLAMQGLLANDWSNYRNGDEDCSMLTRCAINYADALLTQLNQPQP